MHRPGWILQGLINITVDGPLLLTPKTMVLNVFISGCGVPIVAPHENVVRLGHGLVVGSSVFPFAMTGLCLSKLLFLEFPNSFPLTLTDHNLFNKDTIFIRNKPTLALWYTRTTCERERDMDSMGISICTRVTEGRSRIRLYKRTNFTQ
jgi:hypothetical protein